YLILGEIAEDTSDLETADGRPATVAHAISRLARCICCDNSEFTAEDARLTAESVARRQRRRLAHALGEVLSQCNGIPASIVISGQGSFLAERVLDEYAALGNANRLRL